MIQKEDKMNVGDEISVIDSRSPFFGRKGKIIRLELPADRETPVGNLIKIQLFSIRGQRPRVDAIIKLAKRNQITKVE